MTELLHNRHFKVNKILFEPSSPEPNIYKQKVWAVVKAHSAGKIVKAEWVPTNNLLAQAEGERPFGFFLGACSEESNSLSEVTLEPGGGEITIWVGVNALHHGHAHGRMHLFISHGECVEMEVVEIKVHV